MVLSQQARRNWYDEFNMGSLFVACGSEKKLKDLCRFCLIFVNANWPDRRHHRLRSLCSLFCWIRTKAFSGTCRFVWCCRPSDFVHRLQHTEWRRKTRIYGFTAQLSAVHSSLRLRRRRDDDPKSNNDATKAAATR